MKSKYRTIAIVGIVVTVIGAIFTVVLSFVFWLRGFMGMTSPNTGILVAGILILIASVATTFYGRYKYTKAEEQESIDEAKRQ